MIRCASEARDRGMPANTGHIPFAINVLALTVQGSERTFRRPALLPGVGHVGSSAFGPMGRVAATFTFLVLVYPLIAFVMGGEFGVGGAFAVAAVIAAATVILGVPAFVLFFRRGWLSWWQFAFGGAIIGLFCTIPFAVGGAAVVGALAPGFLALGALHGLLFWALAVWRNLGLHRRPTGRPASEPPVTMDR